MDIYILFIVLVLFIIFLYYNTYYKCIDTFNIGIETPPPYTRVATMQKRDKNNDKTRAAFRFAEDFLKNVNYDINYNFDNTLNTITFNLSEKDKIKFDISTDKLTIPIFDSITYIPYIIRPGEIINIFFYILYRNDDTHTAHQLADKPNIDDIDDLVRLNFINTHAGLLNSIKLIALKVRASHARREYLDGEYPHDEYLDNVYLNDEWGLMNILINEIITGITLYNLNIDDIITELHEEDEITSKEDKLIRWILENMPSYSDDINENSMVTDRLMIKDYDILFYIPKQRLFDGYPLDTNYHPPKKVKDMLISKAIKFSDFSFIEKELVMKYELEEEYIEEVTKDILVHNLVGVIEEQNKLHEIYNRHYIPIFKCHLPNNLCTQHDCFLTDDKCFTKNYCKLLSDCNDPVCERNNGICQFKN